MRTREKLQFDGETTICGVCDRVLGYLDGATYADEIHEALNTIKKMGCRMEEVIEERNETIKQLERAQNA